MLQAPPGCAREARLHLLFLRFFHLRLGIAFTGCVLISCGTARTRAEDSDRLRPYLRFHSGDIAPKWGVDDLWSLSLGANFNKHLGAEMTVDFFERDYDYPGLGTLGEVSAWNFVPHFRLRYPLLRDRLVPYTLMGIGPTFLQFNDGRSSTAVDIEGMTFAAAAGAGLEFFIADNVTFGIEAKYIWINPIDGKVDGQTARVDVSAPVFTFGVRVYFDENHSRPLSEPGGPWVNRCYVGLRVGGFMLTDDHWIPGVKLTPEAASIGNMNMIGGLGLGVDLGQNWGGEITVDSLETGIAMENVGTVGEYGMASVIPHLRLRYPLDRGHWVPYFMSGVGLVYGELNDVKPVASDLELHAQGFYPAFSIGAGVEYFLLRNLSFSADVRWLYTWGHEFRAGETMRGNGDFSTAQFTVGLRIYLFESK